MWGLIVFGWRLICLPYQCLLHLHQSWISWKFAKKIKGQTTIQMGKVEISDGEIVTIDGVQYVVTDANSTTLTVKKKNGARPIE